MKDVGIGALIATVLLLLAIIIWQNQRRFHRPLLTTKYQSVMLQNGTIYYGRLDHFGTDCPVLRDIVCIQREVDPGTNRPRYNLVERKDEANVADHMIIPATSIIYVEPVHANSMIGKLIEQSGRR